MSSGSYDVPKWAGKPATGLHLDVMKETKLIQKLMVDEKKCYLFGRKENSTLNDFCIDHQSCSRVHAALVYHQHLKITFLVDLGSTHGTFIGNIRLEAHKPTQLAVDSSFHFGASTRVYILRERPQTGPRPIMDELEKTGAAVGQDGAKLLGLPESETELDNLTEFNTAHNRRIALMGLPDERKPPKKRRIRITFAEEEDIINPEDIDPTVGRFRNMVESTIIPKERSTSRPGLLGTSASANANPLKRPHAASTQPSPSMHHHPHHSAFKGLYDGLETSSGLSRLNMPLPNPAPDISDLAVPSVSSSASPPRISVDSQHMLQAHMTDMMMEGGSGDPDEPKKKKYAKEAWPGRKPQPSFL